MQLVQQHIVNRNHPYWSYFDQQCFLSKNLFNLANYHMRQHFFGTRRVMSFTALYHLVSKSQAYYLLPNTKVAKQVTRRVHKTWLGYKAAHKDWQKHPEKYMGEPKIPKYKDKTKGRYMLVFPLETVSKPPLRKGIVKLTPCPIQFSSGLLNVAELNADVNGSYNIIRKVKSNAFDGYDLKALPFMPSVLDPLRTHDFLQVA